MYDTSMKESASFKSGSSGGSTSTKVNEKKTGSGWDAFEEFVKDADVDKPNKSELKMYLEEGRLKGYEGTNFNVLDWWNIHKLKNSRRTHLVRYYCLPEKKTDLR
ncbi:hypothetical protein QVD17_15262 [Tagetes erecta]|uniref:Uncharacterized protein n=1 Tax=Tagetes erecta TaxID=13708 RepID=A0AAD8NZI8_TARER|nr:hypothetical protein QVD17_15262 [Tagetes erecta]